MPPESMIKDKEYYRLEALKKYISLVPPPDENFDRMMELVAYELKTEDEKITWKLDKLGL